MAAPTKLASRRFSPKTLKALEDSKILGLRAGTGDHRIIGIWMVLVHGRLFVRSWTMKANGWYRTFQENPQGAITVGGSREIPVRAKPVTSERMLAAVDAAYREKYHTPGSRGYVRGFARGRRRATTTELVPR